MKVLKRIFCIVLIITMFMTTTVFAETKTWYDDAYNQLISDEIIIPEADFNPLKTISKIEFLAIVCRAANIIPVNYYKEYWEIAYSTLAFREKVITDFPEEIWRDNINRYEAAEILYSVTNNTLEYKNTEIIGNALRDYPKMPEEYKEIVGQMYLNGIFSGKTNGCFAGEASLTRSEAIMMVYKTFYPEYRIKREIKPYSYLIGDYSTTATKNDNRNFNIAKSAESINGYILNPGEQFSFNEVVGRASKANGYKQSTIIQNGKYVAGYGGGVCQTATTLFNAVLKANLQIDQRTNHGLKSSYVKPGWDATIAYPTLDLKFTNNYDVPIKIVSRFDSETRTVIFEIYSEQYLEIPEVNLYSTGSGRNWTLYREVNGVINYTTKSTYKN